MRRLALSFVMLALVACGSGEAPASSSPEAAEAPTVAPEGTEGTASAGDPEGEGDTAETPTSLAEAPAEASPPDAPPADACARARSCCPAYAAALPSSGPSAADRAGGEQACASLELAIAAGGPAADEACQGALEGFRRSLEATGRDVPSDCR